MVLPPGLRFRWAAPATAPQPGGVMVSFETGGPGGAPLAQQVLILDSGHSDPERAAHDILSQLDIVPPNQWNTRFGRER